MKRMSLTLALIAASFLLGFAFKTIISNKKNTKMKKVTGIGGVFFKCKDPKAINEWYKTHLGFDTSPYGTSFEWQQIDSASGAAKKDLPSGILLQKTQNILSLQQRTL